MFPVQRSNTIVITRYLLRMAIAFAFIYAGVAGLIAPSSWVGYLPSFVSQVMSPMAAITIWSVFEIIFAGMIALGWQDKLTGLTAAALLVLMVLFNFGQISVLFRDLSLAVASTALAVLADEKS